MCFTVFKIRSFLQALHKRDFDVQLNVFNIGFSLKFPMMAPLYRYNNSLMYYCTLLQLLVKSKTHMHFIPSAYICSYFSYNVYTCKIAHRIM